MLFLQLVLREDVLGLQAAGSARLLHRVLLGRRRVRFYDVVVFYGPEV